MVLAMIELLDDLQAWRAGSAAQQEAALVEVAELLSGLRAEGLHEFRCGSTTTRVGVFSHAGTGVPLVLVPGGRYRRSKDGGLRNEHVAGFGKIGDWRDDRDPRLDARVKPFLIGRWTVTRAVGSSEGGEHGGLPWVVSWDHAVGWLEALGAGLRLPTEVEWEWACRGGASSRYFWGDQPDPRYLWCAPGQEPDPLVRPRPVQLEHTNSLGLVDPLGNVWEWCSDAYRVQVVHLDLDPDACKEPWDLRIVRGGSVCVPADRCTCATWFFAPPREARAFNDGPIGFRVAAGLPRRYRPAEAFTAGEQILHASFGPGLVQSVVGRMIDVDFGGTVRRLAHQRG